LSLLTGGDLVILSETSVRIVSANFTSDDIGKTLEISGSYGARNDGLFSIVEVLNSVTVELGGANFDMVDETAMTEALVALSNNLKAVYNRHRIHIDLRLDGPPYTTHLVNDTTNDVVSPDASTLPMCITLLNELRSKFSNHISNSGDDFHINIDQWNGVVFGEADGLASAVMLANELRIRYESHRIERRSHSLGDADSRVTAPRVNVVRQSSPGSLVGPFFWTLYDPRLGMVADSPSDVVVRVNGTPVDAEAVFGMLGAVVLPLKPTPTDTVAIDYDFLNNPPARFLRLNSPEFVLNQDKNNGMMGFPSHRYRARSYLIDPGNTPDFTSAVSPYKAGWKYKACERQYTAASNDPATLLLNSPFKRIKYPVLRTFVKETTISYDPVALPQDASDPWNLEGEGQFYLSSGLLTITDNDVQNTLDSKPPFFTHTSDIITDSIVSAAFRARVDESQLDGVFTGVGFGVSDGFDVILVGFVKTEATNLSSSIAIANDIKAKFNLHLVEPTVHGTDDLSDVIGIVDARDLSSLIILLNALKLKFNTHVLKADPTFVSVDVHKDFDTNEILSDDAENLDTSLTLANELRSKIDAHRTSTGIHFVDDTFNEIPLTMQVGILTNSGAYEFQDSWESGAVNWTVLRTYRVHRDSDGNASLYMSGDVDPLATVSKADLPSISDFGGKFDPVQQVFFGSISREATSVSTWNLIRANISPVNSNLLEDNKSVAFDGSTTPELDLISPWVTLGHGGTERTYPGSPGGVQVDSTCSAYPSEIVAMGASSGAFRGYMRFEPMLAPSTSCAIEFESSVDYYTFGLGNRSNGLFMDDGQLSVHFAFLYFSPSPAHVVGSASTFSVNSSDKMYISFDGSASKTVSFTSTLTSAADVASVINATVGSSIAGDDGLNHVEITYGTGASSYISIDGGSASQKLGLTVGKYFGRDSNPEPRVSWFSEAPPDSVDIPWTKYGSASVQMIGAVHSPVMRLTDSIATEYVTFSMLNPIVVTDVMEPANDWKLDIRLTVDSFTAGDAVPATIPLVNLHFAGVLVNVDEGYGGKNIELHCSVDASGNPYLNLVTYNAGTDTIDPIAQYLFSWNDGEAHSFNIFTNKGADQLFVYADGAQLIPTAGIPAYSSFGTATGATPSVSFGSGAEAVSNVDLKTAVSTVDWESVAVFKDSKLSDLTASSKRYIGIHRGGNPALLSSWYVANVDWASFHTYRIVRDPGSFIAVYLDGGNTPVLSVSYDPIRLPPCSSSFFNEITNDRSIVAWGTFDPQEISRTRWKFVNYSMGKLTLTDRLVPPHQVLNQSNVMASPDHANTGVKHSHFGFSVYSGGTPNDDFMADLNVPAYTILGERVPPVPKTQDLESRGGLVRSAVPAMDVSAVDFINQKGLLGQFENDDENLVSVEDSISPTYAVSVVVDVANDASTAYESHRVRHDVAANVHSVDDVLNIITTSAASDLPTSIVRLIDYKAVFNAHIVDAVSHLPSDAANMISSPDPTDLDSSIVLSNEISSRYGNHLLKGFFHFIPPGAPYFDNLVTVADATDAATCSTLLNDATAGIKQRFLEHVASLNWHGKTANYSVTLNYGSTSVPISFIITLANHLKRLFNQHMTTDGVHVLNDSVNVILTSDAHDVDTAIALTNEVKAAYNAHVVGQLVHSIIGTQDAYYHAPIANPLQSVVELANDILTTFNAHAVFLKSHVEKDIDSLVKAQPAYDTTSAIELANVLKSSFNAHRTAEHRGSKVHVRDDVVNIVSTADATDLDTASSLLNAVKSAYESHREEVGVHGSAAFIRLEAPSRVLYEGMKFWTSEDGVEGLVSSFSDDETWHIDAVKNQSDKSLTYTGEALPEQAVLVSIFADPTKIVDGDTLVLEIDRNHPSTITFQASDTTLLDVVDRINATVPSCASVEGSEIRLESPAPGPTSSVIVNSGTALEKLGFSIPHHSPWYIISNNPSNVSVSLMSMGGENFLRYGVTDASKTVYANFVGYPAMASASFSLNFRVRINRDFGVEDSGVYVGLSGSANVFGYAVAIGWGGTLSNRYVKIQDMNSNEILNKIPFDWYDGDFHTYLFSYDGRSQTFKLSIDP
jgi:hypothetical protein